MLTKQFDFGEIAEYQFNLIYSSNAEHAHVKNPKISIHFLQYVDMQHMHISPV